MLASVSNKSAFGVIGRRFEQDLGIPSNPLISMTYNSSLASSEFQLYQWVWAKSGDLDRVWIDP